MEYVFVTRKIPARGLELLAAQGYTVEVSAKDGVLTKAELIEALSHKPYTALLSLLTDRVDEEVLQAAPSLKIVANYAVGFDNLDLEAAKKRGIYVTNTPDVLTDTVAEHTMALMLSLMTRTVEGDAYIRTGLYHGWEPMLLLGTDLAHKKLGIVGAGRIGRTVARMAHSGFAMDILYFDTARNEALEKETGASYCASVDELLVQADVVSLHVPLLPSTKHLITKDRLSRMKPTAYLINTSRGPVIDEQALVEALTAGTIKGAALDVFEAEPSLAPGLAALQSVILTPHIASASEETRAAMSEVAAKNIIEALEGRVPPNILKAQ